jgi:hypothetical protein
VVLKRVGLPVLVAAFSALLVLAMSRLPPEKAALAAPAGDVTL